MNSNYYNITNALFTKSDSWDCLQVVFGQEEIDSIATDKGGDIYFCRDVNRSLARSLLIQILIRIIY
jgi:hypothetical protein